MGHKITITGHDLSNILESDKTWEFECCCTIVHGTQVIDNKQNIATCPNCGVVVSRPQFNKTNSTI